MYVKASQVKAFFEKPDLYLKSSRKNISVRTTIVKELLGDLSGFRVLDLGCGDGSISLQFLPDMESLTLVDLSSAMLERAVRATPIEYRSRVQYVNLDLSDFHSTQKYDVVLCLGLLAHVESIEQTIERV